MRKIITLFLVLFVFASLFASSILAVEKKNLSASAETSAVPISYDLAYPGMLPDSPFYFVKELRDNVVGFLITSNVNKSFYSLLLSDKRLGAGQILIDTGKTALGVRTIVSSEEYFSNTINSATQAKADKLEISELLAKLSVAVVKHQEVIANLIPKVTGEEKASLDKVYSDSQNSQNRVQELMKKQ